MQLTEDEIILQQKYAALKVKQVRLANAMQLHAVEQPIDAQVALCTRVA
jgi:hypothetical protein